MQITNAIVHQYDSKTEMFIHSDEEIDLRNERNYNFIKDRIDECSANYQILKARFKDANKFTKSITFLKVLLDEIKSKEETIKKVPMKKEKIDEQFKKLQQDISEIFEQTFAECEELESYKLLICFGIIFDKEFIAILKIDTKENINTFLRKKDDKISIDFDTSIITANTKVKEFIFVYLDDMSIQYKTKQYKVDGYKKRCFYKKHS